MNVCMFRSKCLGPKKNVVLLAPMPNIRPTGLCPSLRSLRQASGSHSPERPQRWRLAYNYTATSNAVCCEVCSSWSGVPHHQLAESSDSSRSDACLFCNAASFVSRTMLHSTVSAARTPAEGWRGSRWDSSDVNSLQASMHRPTRGLGVQPWARSRQWQA